MSTIVSRADWDADIGRFVAAFQEIDLDTLHSSSGESLRSYTQLFCGVDPLGGQEDSLCHIEAALGEFETADGVASDCNGEVANDDDDGVVFDRTATSDNLEFDADKAGSGSASPRAKRFRGNGEDGAGSPSDASLASAAAGVESLPCQESRPSPVADGVQSVVTMAPDGIPASVPLGVGPIVTPAPSDAPVASNAEPVPKGVALAAETPDSGSPPVQSIEPPPKKARTDVLDNDPWPCPIPAALQTWLDDHTKELVSAIGKNSQGKPLQWAEAVDSEILAKVGLSALEFQIAFLTFLATKRCSGVLADPDKGLTPRLWLERYHDVVVELYRQRPTIVAGDLVRAVRHNSSDGLVEMNFVSSTIRKLLAEIRPLASQKGGEKEGSQEQGKDVQAAQTPAKEDKAAKTAAQKVKDEQAAIALAKDEKAAKAPTKDEQAAQAPVKDEKVEAPVKDQKAKVTAKDEETEVSAKDEKAKAPAKDDKAKAPAKDDKAKAPAKDDKAKAPAKDDKAKAPAKDDKAKAPAKDDKAKAPEPKPAAASPEESVAKSSAPKSLSKSVGATTKDGSAPTFAKGSDMFCEVSAKLHQLLALLATPDNRGATWRWLTEHHAEVVDVLFRDVNITSEELLQQVAGASTKEVAGSYTMFNDLFIRYKVEMGAAKVLRASPSCSAWIQDHKEQILAKPDASFPTLWEEFGDPSREAHEALGVQKASLGTLLHNKRMQWAKESSKPSADRLGIVGWLDKNKDRVQKWFADGNHPRTILQLFLEIEGEEASVQELLGCAEASLKTMAGVRMQHWRLEDMLPEFIRAMSDQVSAVDVSLRVSHAKKPSSGQLQEAVTRLGSSHSHWQWVLANWTAVANHLTQDPASTDAVAAQAAAQADTQKEPWFPATAKVVRFLRTVLTRAKVLPLQAEMPVSDWLQQFRDHVEVHLAKHPDATFDGVSTAVAACTLPIHSSFVGTPEERDAAFVAVKDQWNKEGKVAAWLRRHRRRIQVLVNAQKPPTEVITALLGSGSAATKLGTEAELTEAVSEATRRWAEEDMGLVVALGLQAGMSLEKFEGEDKKPTSRSKHLDTLNAKEGTAATKTKGVKHKNDEEQQQQKKQDESEAEKGGNADAEKQSTKKVGPKDKDKKSKVQDDKAGKKEEKRTEKTADGKAATDKETAKKDEKTGAKNEKKDDKKPETKQEKKDDQKPETKKEKKDDKKLETKKEKKEDKKVAKGKKK